MKNLTNFMGCYIIFYDKILFKLSKIKYKNSSKYNNINFNVFTTV